MTKAKLKAKPDFEDFLDEDDLDFEDDLEDAETRAIRLTVESWNEFITSLLSAKAKWEAHRDMMRSGPGLECLPIEAQRILRFTSISRASDFERALMQFMQHWRRAGGLKNMTITLS